MARIRTIKPEFFTSLTIADLDYAARLTFIGLWTHVDDEGRCIDDARLIKAALWPLDDRTTADVEADLGALTEASLIVRYEVAGRRYLAVRTWSEHQRINRASASRIPAPDEAENATDAASTSTDESSPQAHGGLSEDSVSAHGGLTTGKERKGKEQGKEESASDGKAADISPEIVEAVDRLCDHLARRIVANGSKPPTVGKGWRDAARLMMTTDGRTEEQIHKAIDWCQSSDFWRSNILSMPKLREKFDQLRLQAQSRSAPGASTSHTPAPKLPQRGTYDASRVFKNRTTR